MVYLVYFLAPALVLSFFVGPRRWLGLVLLLGLAWVAWWLAWSEELGSDEAWWAAKRLALWFGGMVLGAAVRVAADKRRDRHFANP